MKSSEMWLLVGVGVVAYIVLSRQAAANNPRMATQNALNTGINTAANTINRGLNSLFGGVAPAGQLTYRPSTSPALQMGTATPGMQMGTATPGMEMGTATPGVVSTVA